MMVNNNGYIDTEKLSNKGGFDASLGKLFFLCFMTLILSVFGPLMLFAPIPMSMAFIHYGYKKSFLVSGLMILTAALLSTISPNFGGLVLYSVFMFVSVVFAFSVSSIIISNTHPVTGLMKRGFQILVVIASMVTITSIVSPEPLNQYVTTVVSENFEQIKSQQNVQDLIKAGGEEARSLEMLLSDPAKVVEEYTKWVFSALFVGVFFVLWMTFFMVLRNQVVWGLKRQYSFDISHLIEFKVPEKLAYVVVLGLVLYLGAEYVSLPILEVIGLNILLSMAIFYFFQGMNVYLAFLTYLNIQGILRNFLTVMTIFFAFRFVAFIGFFDLWVNFKKFFKKNEGDIS